MKKAITMALCAMTPVVLAGNVNEEVLKKIEMLQQQIEQQQVQIEALKTQLSTSEETVTDLVKAEVDTALETKGVAQVSDVGSVINLPSWIDAVDVSGNLQLKWERKEFESTSEDEEDEERFRSRIRLGGVWHNEAESWVIGLGLVTGDVEDCAPGDTADAPNTWSEADIFDAGDIRWDYAYAKHIFQDDLEGLAVLLGQTPFPYTASWAFFDQDIRPIGATAVYTRDCWSAMIGWYDVFNPQQDGGDADNAFESDAMLYALQLGWAGAVYDVDAQVAVAYYHYNEVTTANSPDDVELYGDALDDDYNFQILDLFVSGQTDVTEDVAVDMYGQVWVNVGADGEDGTGQLDAGMDPESEDVGWIIGLGACWGPWSLSYSYAAIGADSAPSPVVDNTFVTGGLAANTNVEAHSIAARYNMTEHASVGASAVIMESDEDYQYMDYAVSEESTLYTFDFIYDY